LAALLAAAPACAADPPKWLKELRKDFANIDKARKNHAELHRGLARKWLERDRIDDVIGEYGLRAVTHELDPPTHYGYGYAYAIRDADGDLVHAEARLRRAIELDPAFVLAYFTLGGVLHKTGEADAAVASYSECVRLDETHVAAHYAMGEVYRLQDDAETALAAYTLAIDMAKRDWKFPHFGKAQVYYDLEDDAQAETETQRVLELDGKYAPAYFLLGQIRAVQGLDTAALELYRQGGKHGDGYPPKELHNLGRIFAYRGNHVQAESLYRQGLALLPSDAPLHFDLAEAVWAQGRREDAIAGYRTALAGDPTYTDYFTELVQAEFFTADLPPTDARVALDKALAIDPTDHEAHVLYAQVETAVGDVAAGIAHYQRARDLAPDRPDIHFPLGDLYYAHGAVDAAREALRRGLDLNPSEGQRYADAGDGMFARQEYRFAVAAYGKHALLHPDDVGARYYLARSLEEVNDVARAIVEYEHVRETAPTTEDSLVRLAALYGGRGDTSSALDVLTELVGIEPTNVAAHFARGEILAGVEDVTGATAAFEGVISLDPSRADAHYLLAGLYEERDDDAAIEAYTRVIALDPDGPAPYFKLGAVHLRLGDDDAVIDAYKEGLLLLPRRGDAQYTLARLLDKRGDLSDAVPHYAIAVDVKDDDPAWHFDYARCAHRVGDASDDYDVQTAMFVAADSSYTAAILLEPTPPRHYHRGMLRRAHRQTGDGVYLYSEVADDFKQVLSLDPEHADARYNLGLTYVDMEQDSRARQTFRSLLQAHPKYVDAHAELGAIAEREQEYEKAINEYEAELRVAPDSARAHFRVGYLYQVSRGDPGTASEHLSKAVELDPTSADAHVEFGRVLYQLDRLRAAADQFEHALKIDGRNLTANYNLAMVYQYMDRRSLAVERFRYLLTLDLPGAWKAEAEGYLRQLEGQ
jgi:tetratricopeptide (TPR) repeat protein